MSWKPCPRELREKTSLLIHADSTVHPKTLGLHWDSTQDHFYLAVPPREKSLLVWQGCMIFWVGFPLCACRSNFFCKSYGGVTSGGTPVSLRTCYLDGKLANQPSPTGNTSSAQTLFQPQLSSSGTAALWLR